MNLFRRRAFTTNHMKGFNDFLASWDDPSHPRNRELVTLHETSFGNISQTGNLGDYRGHALSRWHPQFRASIEPGVRDLVLILVERFGYITYTSCDGHPYPSTTLRPTERHVSLLPRTGSELGEILELMVAVSHEANRTCRGQVRVTVVRHDLETELSPHPVITWFFFRRGRRVSRNWDRYFAEVDTVTDTLAAGLRRRLTSNRA